MSDHLGGRLPLLDPQSLQGAQKALSDRIIASMVPWAEAAGFESRTPEGRLIGPFNILLYSPEIGDAFLSLQAAEHKHTALSERVRQIVILTVGSVWRAAYELYAHAAVGRKAGLSGFEVDALARGDLPDGLGDEERIAQRFTRHLAVDRRVADDLYREAQAAFGDKALVDMIVLAGCYHVICSLLNAFEVPVPASDHA